MTEENVEEESGINRRTYLYSTAAAMASSAAASGTAAAQSNGNSGNSGTEQPDKNFSKRLARAYQIRKEAANKQTLTADKPQHETPERQEGYIGSYTKGLPHNEYGEPDVEAYETMVDVATGEATKDELTLSGSRPQENPTAAESSNMIGADPLSHPSEPYPAFDSREAAIEMVELYWMALARDVPFAEYSENEIIQSAAAELSELGADEYGIPTDPESLFRMNSDLVEGTETGPYISQFAYKKIPRTQRLRDQKRGVYKEGEDFMTSFDDWLSIQRGERPTESTSFETRRYLMTGRDMAGFVDGNAPAVLSRNASLITFLLGVPFADSVPTTDAVYETVDYRGVPVSTFVTSIIQPLLRHNFYDKWALHRRGRPSVLGGRLHVDLNNEDKSYPLHPLLAESEAVARTREKYGTALLPQAYPQGSPMFPSYPSGHAALDAAGATILKALLDEDYVFENPVAPTSDGRGLEPIDAELTLGHELNKMAANAARGRDFGGIHYYSDDLGGLRQGQKMAIEFLKDKQAPISVQGTLSLTKFNGETITIEPSVEST